MKRLSAVAFGAMALLVLTAAPAKAQVAWVSGGYTVQGWGGNWNDAQGFGVDYGFRIHKTSKTAGALYVDFSQNRMSTDFDKETDTGIVGGFREFFFTDQRVQPFVHASAGSMHFNETMPFVGTGNDFIVGGGFGAQFKINNMWGVKAQWDFWKPREMNEFTGENEWSVPIYRWYFAAVYTWGAK